MPPAHTRDTRRMRIALASVLPLGLLMLFGAPAAYQQIPLTHITPDSLYTISMADHFKIQEQPKPVPPSEVFATAGWEALAELSAYEVACGGKGSDAIDLKDPLLAFAASITSQNIIYNSEDLSDTSGIIHRTLQSMQNQCPAYEVPLVQIRSSRALAQWYEEKGELIIINDAEQMAELIKPGAVMFYGTNGRRFSFPEDPQLENPQVDNPRQENPRQEVPQAENPQFEDPLLEDQKFVVSEDIQHIGVVVGVDRNDAGELINYHLFHGRRTGLAAAITGIESEGTFNHLRKESPNHPPFGNGNQQWVAMARILNPAMRTD